jgi:hypothetical protein
MDIQFQASGLGYCLTMVGIFLGGQIGAHGADMRTDNLDVQGPYAVFELSSPHAFERAPSGPQCGADVHPPGEN